MMTKDDRTSVRLSKIFNQSCTLFSTPLLMVSFLALANQVSGQACPDGATGSCFEVHATPGCDSLECCDLVCVQDPICCKIEWDSNCTKLASDQCGCNKNDKPDDSDCNGNGIPDDDEEGPRVCVDSTSIPVDLIVIADPSGSDSGKMPSLCAEVFNVVVERLHGEYDLQPFWTSVTLDAPGGTRPIECDDWMIPQGTPVPVCQGVESRFIDDPDGEEWGDATAGLTTPNEDHLLGGLPGWVSRDAVLILIPISDEGPQNGHEDEGDTCGCKDELSARNLIKQAQLQNAQVIPMPTEGPDQCNYDINGSVESGLMFEVAQATLGSVVDARVLDVSQIADDLEAAIREAVAISPRLNSCPKDISTDNVVDGLDLALVLGKWGTPEADVNCDGTTDGGDLALVLGAWGPCPIEP